MKTASERCAHLRFVRAFILILALLAFAAFARGQTILYVDDDAPPGGDGLTWNTAFNDLQDALSVPRGPQSETIEIRVGQGRYVPSARIDPKDPRSATFRLSSGLFIKGSYAGYGAPSPDEHSTLLYPSELSGDVLGNDLPQFTNYGDNVYHVLFAEEVAEFTQLDGLLVRSGHSNIGDGIRVTTHLGGGLFARASHITIVNCTFMDNSASYGGAIYGRDFCQIVVADSCFFGNRASHTAGGIRLQAGGSLEVANSKFESNEAGYSGGAIGVALDVAIIASWTSFVSNSCHNGNGGAVLITTDASLGNFSNCEFAHNVSTISSGALYAGNVGMLTHCTFKCNSSYVAGALMLITNGSVTKTTLSNSTFIHNEADYLAGALLVTHEAEMINCVIYENRALVGGGLATLRPVALANCTITKNQPGGLTVSSPLGDLVLDNCIVWGNAPYQLGFDEGGPPPPPSLIGLSFSVANSLVQGGYDGEGNIDADPIFIQSGCGNLRLGPGSPCIDAGDNSAIPPGITTDLAGNPRIANNIVDMGAYEGEHEMLPPTACADDIDEGEFIQLTPAGAPFDPVLNPAATIINESAQNDAFAIVAQHEAQLHPGAEGFYELGSKLAIETSLVPGTYFMRIFISFDHSHLNGFDPLIFDLTHFNANAGEYELATASNIQASPGHRGPLGDRQVVVGTAWQGQLSFDPGDYGVFWNPDLEKGFVWANVDHASDFAFGVPLPECTGDCTFPADSAVNLADLTLVIDNWGIPPAGPAIFTDVNNDGIVDVNDLLAVINNWGECK